MELASVMLPILASPVSLLVQQQGSRIFHVPGFIGGFVVLSHLPHRPLEKRKQHISRNALASLGMQGLRANSIARWSVDSSVLATALAFRPGAANVCPNILVLAARFNAPAINSTDVATLLLAKTTHQLNCAALAFAREIFHLMHFVMPVCLGTKVPIAMDLVSMEKPGDGSVNATHCGQQAVVMFLAPLEAPRMQLVRDTEHVCGVTQAKATVFVILQRLPFGLAHHVKFPALKKDAETTQSSTDLIPSAILQPARASALLVVL